VAYNEINGAANALTWQPGDVLFDLYEVRPVVEGLGDAAEEKSCHRGGFGQVYKVYHRGWNLELAMKAPLPGVFENEDQVEDFTRECETWVELGLHPHIVTCYYVRNFNSQPLVFAEYLSGGSLREWIDSGLLYEGGPEEALKRILDIAIQTAWGLNYAHEQGLVHQDVKPANVMFTPEGRAKISDFGTARARARAAAGTVTVSPGTILVSQGGMTPAYCSPEQSLGEKLTRRTDIWSWGLMVLVMFTGEVTWATGVAAAQALQAYLYHGGEEEVIPPMPRDLAMLLERCFRSEEARPQNFDQITDELTQIYRNSCGLDYPRTVPKAADHYAGSLNNRALSMHDLGRKEEAEKLWAEALLQDPTNLAATYNLGLIQWRSGKINDDILVQKIEGLCQGQPTARAAYLLAMVQAERLDYRSAVKLLEKVVSEGDEDYEIENLLEWVKQLENGGAECIHTFEGDTGRPQSVCLSLNNRYVLAGSSNRKLKLWEVESGKCLRTFEGHNKSVNSVCLNPDGRYALSGSWDNTLKLWDVESGKCLRTFEGHAEALTSVSLSADGRYALSGSSDKTLKLWKAESGICLRTFVGHAAAVRSVCLSADSRYALSGSRDKSIKLWDVESGRCLRTFEGCNTIFNSVCLSSDCRYALSGSSDKTLKLWDVESGKCLRNFKGHTATVRSVCLSADSRYALSGSRDNTLKLWDVVSGKCLRTFETHTMSVQSVCISSDGRYALSGSLDKTLKLWSLPWFEKGSDYLTAQLEAHLVFRTEEILIAEEAFSELITKTNCALLAGDLESALLSLRSARLLPGRFRDRQLLNLWVKLYPYFKRSKYIDGWPMCTYEGFTDGVTSTFLSVDGRYTLSGNCDATLKLWAVGSGKCLQTFEGHKEEVAATFLSADGCYALSGGGFEIKLWEVASGKCLRTFEGHTEEITSIILSADNLYALSGSWDKSLKLWELKTGECLRTFEGHTDAVTSVSLSADGCCALSGSSDKSLIMWDVESGKCLRNYEGHTDSVDSIYLSADSRYALSGSWDKTLKLWDVESGNCLHTFEGHAKGVAAVCLSADGRHALSGSRDKALKLWEVESKKCLRTFVGHTGGVLSVCFSADCRYAISGSSDDTLRLWELYWDLE
jgi:WD40 repeat protein/serine/threonine protein kinase